MIMQGVLNATDVRKEFSHFIDSVVHDKPQVVKRNRDMFWAISQEVATDLFAAYTFSLEFEQEDDGTFVGSLIPMQDIIGFGATYDDMIDDLAKQLVEYAKDYYDNFARYYHAPNRKAHLPFILNILTQENIDKVKGLING